jgi:hypothetical protein
MADFAIVDNGAVVNVIVADDEATAEAVTGLDVLPIVDGVPGMGWTLESEGWRQPAPFASWEWDGAMWQPPIPYPSDGAAYVWDEDAGDWIEYVAPEPEPEPDTE